MQQEEIKRSIGRGVLSGYVALGLRLVMGLFSFRILYSSLEEESFGYWALLWSVFGYGVLLDFGLGVTVQKKVAQLSVDGRWGELNRSLSTIFFSYCGIGVLVFGGGWFFAEFWVRAVGVSAERQEEFRDVFRLFLAGMGLMFPSAIFCEVLRGLQRVALANYLAASCGALTFGGVAWAALTGHSLLTVVGISLLGSLSPGVLSAWFARKLAPEIQIRPEYFSRSELRSLTGFSFIAYFIMISHLIMTKTDLMVISTWLGVAAVVLYQPGAKVAELFTAVTKQLADVLQPVGARLYAQKDHAAIAKLLEGGIRYSAVLSTPLYLGISFYLPVVIRALTGEQEPNDEVIWVGQALLLWSYSYVLTHNVYKQIALMGGHERRLLWVGVLEAGLNLVASVAAVAVSGKVIGVAIGTLIPSMVVGWGILWGWSAAEVGVGRMEWVRRALARTWLSNLPLLVILIGFWELGWTRWSIGPVRLLGGMVLAGIVAIWLLWRFSLTPDERRQVASRRTRG